MTPEEAFQLIENFDYAEGLKRKFAPGYSLIQINREGDVVCVERFKERTSEAEQLAVLKKHPGTIQLNGKPGMYATVDEFRDHIKSSMWLFSKMKPPTA